MAKKEFTKVSIGEETVVGTAVAVAARVPITDLSVLVESPEKSETGIIVGRRTNGGTSLDAISYTQDIPTVLTGNKANHFLMKSLMGIRSTPVAFGGSFLILYSGSAESCKLVVTATTISSYIGDIGAETLDTQFGTDGVYTPGTTLKLSELVAAINAFANGYTAVKLNGIDDTVITALVNTGNHQAKDCAAPILCTCASSKAYITKFTPTLDDTENPTESILVEGAGDNVLGVGAAVDSMELSAELKGKATLKYSLKVLKSVGGQNASGLKYDESDLNPMKFNNGQTYISGKKFFYVKSHSLTISNNISDDEGWGQGSLYKSEHCQGKLSITGTNTVKLTTDDPSSEAEAKKIASDDESALLLEYQGLELSSGLNEECIIDIPKIQYTGGSKSAGTNNLEQSLEFSAVDDAELYGDIIAIYLIDGVSA